MTEAAAPADNTSDVDQTGSHAGSAGVLAGASNDPWYAVFGDNVALAGINPSLDQFDSPQAFLEQFNYYAERDSRSTLIPTAEAPQDQWDQFYERLTAIPGVMRTPEGYDPPPAEPGGYVFEPVEGYDHDAAEDAAFAQKAHELGLNRAQAAGMRQWLAEGISQAQNAQERDVAAAHQVLMDEWGPAADRNIEAGSNVLKALEVDTPGLTHYLSETNQLNHPVVMKLMHSLARRTNEPKARDAGEPGGVMTRGEAQQRITEARMNRDTHPAFDPTHPQHDLAKRELDRWYAIAHGIE